MMSGIPLPQQFSQQPGGPQQMFNALAQSGAQAKYAPYTAYADAASKIAYANMLPYQIQAQVMSNPMLFYAYKDHPEMLQGMMNSLMKSVPQGGNVFGNIKMPPPGGGSGLGGGFLGTLGNAFLSKLGLGGSGSSDSNAMNQPTGSGAPSSGGQDFGDNNPTSPAEVTNIANNGNNATSGQPSSGLLPSSNGGMSGYTAKVTAPGTVSPYAAGATLPDPNDPSRALSVPTGKEATAIQQQLLAEKRVEPQLARIADEWSPFMDVPAMGKLIKAGIGNATGASAETLKRYGIDDPDLVSKYSKAKATTAAAPEALVKAYGLNATNETLERLQSTIEPRWGENKNGYMKRIKQTLSELKSEQEAPSQQSLVGGFNVPNASSTPSNNNSSTVSGGGGGFDVNKMLSYKYSNADEFKQALNSLNAKNKQAVINEMHRRGWK